MSVLTDNTSRRERQRVARRYRRADIQGLRAIAVLAVIAYHAGLPLPGGFNGVDVFFVISGYVITEMLLREWQQTGRLRLGLFYLRRFKRLVPALSLVVVVTVLLAIVVIPPLADENRVLLTAIGAMTFSANIVIDLLTDDYFAMRAQSNPLLHTWTLSVEEQFYLVFPLILLAGLTLGIGRVNAHGRAFTGIALVSALSLGLTVTHNWVGLPFGDHLFGFYSPLSRAWEFGVGALIALARPGLRLLTPWLASLMVLAGLAVVATGFVAINQETVFPGFWTLLPVVGTALAIIGGSGNRGSVPSSILGIRGLGVIGDWSYSLYLWHWPLIVFAHLTWEDSTLAPIIAAAISVIPAVASYYFVERPLRERPTPKPRQIVGFIGLTLLGPAAVLLAKDWASTTFVQPMLIAAVGDATKESVSVERGCLTRDGFGVELIETCTWGVQRDGPPIVLFGDSNAAHFDEALLVVAGERNRPLTMVTSPTCLPIANFEVYRPDGDKEKPWCDDYVSFVIDYVQSQPGATVVMAFSDGMALREDRLFSLNDSPPESDTLGKADLVATGLSQTIDYLTQAEVQVVLVQPVPSPKIVGQTWSPQECNMAELLAGSCQVAMDRTEMARIQGPTRDAIAAAASLTDSAVLDFESRYCQASICTTSTGSRINFRDDHHLTIEASQSLASDFLRVIA